MLGEAELVSQENVINCRGVFGTLSNMIKFFKNNDN